MIMISRYYITASYFMVRSKTIYMGPSESYFSKYIVHRIVSNGSKIKSLIVYNRNNAIKVPIIYCDNI